MRDLSDWVKEVELWIDNEEGYYRIVTDFCTEFNSDEDLTEYSEFRDQFYIDCKFIVQGVLERDQTKLNESATDEITENVCWEIYNNIGDYVMED